MEKARAWHWYQPNRHQSDYDQLDLTTASRNLWHVLRPDNNITARGKTESRCGACSGLRNERQRSHLNDGTQELLMSPQGVSRNDKNDSDMAFLPRHHTMKTLGPSIALEVVSSPLMHPCSNIKTMCCTDDSADTTSTWARLPARAGDGEVVWFAT